MRFQWTDTVRRIQYLELGRPEPHAELQCSGSSVRWNKDTQAHLTVQLQGQNELRCARGRQGAWRPAKGQ